MENGRSLDGEGNWTQDPVEEGTFVLEVLEGPENADIPEYVFTEEEGIMTGMSFTVLQENSNTWASGCQEERLLSVLSFAGAKRKGNLFDGGTDKIVTFISEHPFEDFSFTANGVIVTCEVKYSGYMDLGDALYPEEGKEQENSFYLCFEMRQE